ncbi:hypothetical protein NRI_0759 [Neorickettsia risticii str. Illinois]|uniref:Uncharacterized protein n=1 Tax=Neorickettsia risticii (strain Illinois) TaxID=434131 RepID=C6V5R5_NEORI|nr:hypothetical protein NRI_0759 [Neorickettsia risticii str. Illinois]
MGFCVSDHSYVEKTAGGYNKTSHNIILADSRRVFTKVKVV